MRVAMLAYAFYEGNARIHQYVRALVERGDTVDLFVLGRERTPKFEQIDGANVYKIQNRDPGSEGRLAYAANVALFMLRSGWALFRRHLARRYDVIHVHSVPDYLVFATLPVKLLGASVILDIHDILPEFYASKFGASTDSIIFRILVTVEKLSVNFSDHVVIANHIWHDRLISRSVKPDKLSTITNYPNPKFFYPGKRTRSDGRFIILYPGTLNRHQGVDIALEAFARICKDMPEAEYHIYGEGPERQDLERRVKDLGLESRIIFFEFLPTDGIATVMANSDLAIVPKRTKRSFGDEAASTKILEFMSVGVPVIVSRTKIDSYYHSDATVKFFNPEDVDDLADAIRLLHRDSHLRKSLAANALAYAQQHRWDERKKDYLAIVDSLAGRPDHPQSEGNSNSSNSYDAEHYVESGAKRT